MSAATQGQAPRVLVIRGSEWCRGDAHESYLRTAEGTYCCLGLRARDFGLADEALTGVGGPAGLSGPVPEGYRDEWLAPVMEHSTRAYSAMRWNDAPGLSDEQRIERLRPVFAEVGIALDFRPDE